MQQFKNILEIVSYICVLLIFAHFLHFKFKQQFPKRRKKSIDERIETLADRIDSLEMKDYHKEESVNSYFEKNFLKMIKNPSKKLKKALKKELKNQ